MPTFLFDSIVFGPVRSRRLGISLGINLLPNDRKLCNFNCIYCECGWNHVQSTQGIQLHKTREVKTALEKKLATMKSTNEEPDVITFAGNGEPTLHPDFPDIIDTTIRLRNQYCKNAKIAVLSNGSMIHKKEIFEALHKVDQNILKLDAGTEKTCKLINKPKGRYSLDKYINQLKKFKGQLIIQSLFFRGETEGQTVDNTTNQELQPWLKLINKIHPNEVMIYTYQRDTAQKGLNKISWQDLEKIAIQVNKLGIKTAVFD
jgi:wyosine [tRNA(Phe)-imidazoG37] synthetase (radical SAM superfamily)